jgi:uncharacterized protein YjiS (DUF1127 family)
MLNSSGSMNGVPLRDSSSITHENRAMAPRLDLTDVKSPPAITPTMTRADRRNIGPWPSIFTFLMEGFALYGASYGSYGALLNDIATSPAEPSTRQPGKISPFERRKFISIVSPSASPGVTAPERETCRNWLARPWRAIASRRAHWRRQREIKMAVAALTKLDDGTLRDIGIPHRSQIERVVRYCRDC